MTAGSLLLIVIVRDNGLNLPALIQAALATGHELLVIDGSEDRGLEKIAALPCRTLRLDAPDRGYGAAVRAGASLAAQLGCTTLVTLPADGRHDPADIRLLVAEAEKQELPCLVIGSRMEPAAPHCERSRKGSAEFLTRLECGLEIPDASSLFRLFPVKELLALKFSRSRHFAAESIVRFAWSGLPVVAVPVPILGQAAAGSPPSRAKIQEKLSLFLLHGRLVARRLLPLPHQCFVPEESLHRKMVETFSQNPFKVLGRLCREHTSPLWLAMAVWLGIFMGALPLFSVHTIAIIYVAHRLHVNKVAAVAASQFCMPPVVPVLCIQIGYYLRKGELLFDFSWQRWLFEIHERFWEWLIGSLLLGPLLGFIGAGIMYWMAVRLRTGLSDEG